MNGSRNRRMNVSRKGNRNMRRNGSSNRRRNASMNRMMSGSMKKMKELFDLLEGRAGYRCHGEASAGSQVKWTDQPGQQVTCKFGGLLAVLSLTRDH